MFLFQKMTKQKCFACAKNVGVFGIKCRCSDISGNRNIFCSACIQIKFNDANPGHLCSFDYREFEQATLYKNNEVVKCIKVPEI